MTAHRRIHEPHWARRLRRRLIGAGVRMLSGTRANAVPPPIDPATDDIRAILICRPNHRLGNLVLLTPLVAELERTFPGARIDLVLAGDDGPELFQAYAPVRRVYALSRRMVRHPLATVRVALQIHRAHYDLAIDPCETSQSGRLLLLAAAARHTLATATTRRQRNGPPATPPRHLACVPVFLLRQHLAEAAPAAGAECPPLDLRLTAVERQQGLGALQRALPMPRAAAAALTLGVFCEASGAKRYGPDWWRRFVHGVRTAHPGAALMEIVPADGIARLDLPAFGSPSPRRVAAVIANLTYFVSADCGVMHLACAAGTPTIGLFKASDAAKYGPYGRGSCALLTAGKTAEEVAEDVAALIRARPEGTRCKLPAAPAAHAIASRSSTAHAS